MRILNLEECKDVIKRYNRAQPPWAIAAELGITRKDIRAIRHCQRFHRPMDNYLVEYDNFDPRETIDENPCAWDIRLSMKLARLPMSEWAAAL